MFLYPVPRYIVPVTCHGKGINAYELYSMAFLVFGTTDVSSWNRQFQPSYGVWNTECSGKRLPGEDPARQVSLRLPGVNTLMRIQLEDVGVHIRPKPSGHGVLRSGGQIGEENEDYS